MPTRLLPARLVKGCQLAGSPRWAAAVVGVVGAWVVTGCLVVAEARRVVAVAPGPLPVVARAAWFSSGSAPASLVAVAGAARSILGLVPMLLVSQAASSPPASSRATTPSNRRSRRRGIVGAGGRTGRDGRRTGPGSPIGFQAGAGAGLNAGTWWPAGVVGEGGVGIPTGPAREGVGAGRPAWPGPVTGWAPVGGAGRATTSSQPSQARIFGPEGRASGSLASSAVISGVREPARRIGCGASLTTAARVAIDAPLSNGGWPSTAKYSVAPSAQKSAGGPVGSPWACSGAM